MITSMYDFKDENGNIMSYEEYEERKIMEAVEIAEKIERGEIETITFEEFKKGLDELMERIIAEHKNNNEEEVQIAY